MSYFNHIYSASPDELPHRTRAVYIYLRNRAGKGSDCWPAVKTIASDLQLSRSTIKRALNDLVKAGLLKRKPVIGKMVATPATDLFLKMSDFKTHNKVVAAKGELWLVREPKCGSQ